MLDGNRRRAADGSLFQGMLSMMMAMRQTFLFCLATLMTLGTGGVALGKDAPNRGVEKADKPITEAAAWETLASEFGGSKAETRPSRDVIMGFSFPSEIREITVVGGQKVKAGQVMVRARDAEVVAAIQKAELLADNDLEVQGALGSQELAEFRFEQLKKGQSFSPSEFEELRIQAKAAKIQADQAKVNLLQRKHDLTQLQGQYERYRLEAPFDGTIEEVMGEVGQSVTEQSKVLRVVNTEHLWLDAYAQTPQTIDLGIRGGERAWVLMDLPGRARLVEGRVLYISPVADAVSQTRRVRVEIDNPTGLPAGTQARVRLVKPEQRWMTLGTMEPARAELEPRAEDNAEKIR